MGRQPLQQQSLAPRQVDQILALSGAEAIRAVEALYVHVPFCFHKCHYCDFYSITQQSPQRMAAYVDRVLAEAEKWTGHGALRPRTIFFGGGTPTLLPTDELGRLVGGLRERIDASGLEEWTVEANPATLSAEAAGVLRSLGVDRLSFGAQSFDRGLLAALERHHHPDDVLRSLSLAREAGFRRLNIDLIYAIPGQSLAQWQQTLELAVGLGCEHLSCYGLTYEPNTPMGVKKRLSLVKPAAEELELEMLGHTRRRLADAGYEAYEISNYSRPGARCRHNLIYWAGGSYLGLGPSAASHLEGVRWRNKGHLGEWEQMLDAGGLPADELERLTPRQRAGELAWLALRVREGVDFADFTARTGYDAQSIFAGELTMLRSAELILIDAKGFRLTEKGIALADGVAQRFLEGP